MNAPEARLAQAKYEAERARKRLVSTAGELQCRMRPATLMGHAWDGVRDKSGELAEGAMQAVKDRPVKASGVAAAVALFLARHTIWSAVSGLWNHSENDEVTTPTATRANTPTRQTRGRRKKEQIHDDA